MSTSTIEALASAWARIAEEAEFPADYEGTATPQAHRASCSGSRLKTGVLAFDAAFGSN